MKILIDTEDDAALAALAGALAKHLTNVTVSVPAAEAPAPTKPAGKPAKPPKAAAAPPEDGPTLTQPEVQKLLKDYAAKNGREKAMAILNKYAGSVSELSDADLPKVAAELNGKAPAEADVDF